VCGPPHGRNIRHWGSPLVTRQGKSLARFVK